MATFQKFEDIESWQKARLLTKAIYRLTASGEFARDAALRGQIRRASVSIMSNIAEGFGREGKNEFIQSLSDSKGSCNEVQSQLYVALDAQFITSREFEDLYAQAAETIRLISGLMRYLQTSPIKGKKFQYRRSINSKPQTLNPKLSL